MKNKQGKSFGYAIVSVVLLIAVALLTVQNIRMARMEEERQKAFVTNFIQLFAGQFGGVLTQEPDFEDDTADLMSHRWHSVDKAAEYWMSAHTLCQRITLWGTKEFGAVEMSTARLVGISNRFSYFYQRLREEGALADELIEELNQMREAMVQLRNTLYEDDFVTIKGESYQEDYFESAFRAFWEAIEE